MKLIRSILEPLRPRLKPSFFLVGVQKAGTSALFNMISAHPKIIGPERKEIHYFDLEENFQKGDGWYLKQFPIRPLRGNNELTFEATPCYMYRDNVASRLYDRFPAAKIVVILRDPVIRAYSAWNMRKQFREHPLYSAKYESRSFEEAVLDEMENGSEHHPLNDLLARGDYAPQLMRYFELFGEKNVLVINYKEFKRNPSTILNEIFRHVGLSETGRQIAVLNDRVNQRTYSEPLSKRFKHKLYLHFKPKINDLHSLLGYGVDIIE